jgi:hypothetical protein
MKKLRNVGIALAMGAVAAIPLGGTLAGAQDAGDCGSAGPAVSATSDNLGGLVGSLIPVTAQVIAPVNAPISSPSQGSCNSNSNSVGGGGGSHGGGGGGGGPVWVAPASAVGGAPRFAG